jgi:phenylpyruvate tautomerase PptA (4-oxalocrotonate tautomerase family)
MIAMPFTRISLRKGKPAEYHRAIGDSLHTALVDNFEVPEKDRFQVIHQHEEHEITADENYLSGPRSADYVLFCISAGRPRSAAVKKAFYGRLVELLEKDPGLRPEDVMVIVTNNSAEDWHFGGRT